MDKTDFRQLCGRFATGITVLTTTHNGQHHGITINSFTSVSIVPPLVLFCINKEARFNAPLIANTQLTINILSDKQQDISNRFANPSLSPEERFKDLALKSGHEYPVFVDSLACLVTKLHATHDGGDHWIYIAEVSKGSVFGGSPLLYNAGSYASVAPNS